MEHEPKIQTRKGHKYVIQLDTIGGNYLCYPRSTFTHLGKPVAVIYHHDDPRLVNDLRISKGFLVEVSGEVAYDVFSGHRYGNQWPSREVLEDEYKLTLRGMARTEDDKQGTFEFGEV